MAAKSGANDGSGGPLKVCSKISLHTFAENQDAACLNRAFTSEAHTRIGLRLFAAIHDSYTLFTYIVHT